ncbi:unnamed protein product [Arabidopsis thaliana]|uniref:Gnk2-homologous domain-containing protein n=1 Tax=Arabidopsis thaliana TaxID=3702 RepID=A0A654FHN3_ARATH|nr:cysteine-rich repeat secretory protein [Arabidopsis thaliana]AEE76584.1 cysteine-rich repeat secretory protein [Arabidopsis thaliana]VYS58201.1 unnamed protein product [Arabidopsis thaliana]|eukprot:NP_001154637.1 cysteine-rich repeat secretory protein [Arabidopsis thaliana]
MNKTMYSSYSLSKRLVSIPILAIQLLLIRSVSSLNLTNDYLNHKCLVSQGKYRPGDKYEDNLNFLTRECRGDSYDSKCLSCYATALSGIIPKEERLKECFLYAQPKQHDRGHGIVQQENKGFPLRAHAGSHYTQQDNDALRSRGEEARDKEIVCNGTVCARHIAMKGLFGMEYQ